MHTNHEAVMRDYAQAGVLLSLSGRHHPGQPLSRADGVHKELRPARASLC